MAGPLTQLFLISRELLVLNFEKETKNAILKKKMVNAILGEKIHNSSLVGRS